MTAQDSSRWEVGVRVELAHADAAAQIVRADTKAAGLLPLFGGALAGVVALATRPLPSAAGLVLWGAAVPALVAVLLLLLVLRPRFGPGDDFGFSFLARFADEPAGLLDTLAGQPAGAEVQAADAVRLAVIAATKFRRVRGAVDCLLLSLLLVAAALAVTAVA
ncbi:Pycsar system effector family protein [Actinosynnema sp. CS-041913]|uniref:Pycsar system effector family protein n=1 Tax=Actinosynnema sp. CS-041913 TaxID=3239917 RepID=UPI003D8CF184